MFLSLQIYWPPLPGQKEECFRKGKDPVVSDQLLEKVPDEFAVVSNSTLMTYFKNEFTFTSTRKVR